MKLPLLLFVGSLLIAPLLGARYVVVDDLFDLYVNVPESFIEVASPEEAAALADDTTAVLVPGHAKLGTIEAVAKHKTVRALSVRQNTLRSKEATSIAGMETLDYLGLYACVGLNEELGALLATLPALRTLILNATSTIDTGTLAALSKAPHIEFISFNALKGEDAEVGALQRLKSFKALRGVSLSFSKVSEPMLKAVCAVPGLELLDLSYSQFDHKLAAELLGTMHHLRALDLAKVCSGPLLKALSSRETLTGLRISSCELADADVKQLSKLTRLEWLDVQHNHDLTDESLSALGNLKSLRVLRLCWTGLTDEGLDALSALELHELDVEGCDALTNDAIAILLKMKTLKALNLSWHSSISGETVRRLAALEHLLRLGVNYCDKVSKADVKHLRDTCPALEVCDVGID